MKESAPISRDQWKSLLAAQSGYLLDAMDVLLYVFAINTLKKEFGLSNSMAGLIGSATLVSSAAGGILFGVMADRLGRTRTLVYTILLYSLGSGGTATAHSFGELIFWRAVVGFGLGGEWSAGAVLVSETWPPERRGQAIGWMQSCWALGYMLAAGVTALVLPRFGWRVLFLTGLAPALLALAIRRSVPEPPLWKARPAGGSFRQIFRPPLGRRTLAATSLTTSVLFAYWGLFTWIPGFLSAGAAEGGAGLSILGTSAWIFPMQAGAFLGYVTFGIIADRAGRRPAFLIYVLAAAVADATLWTRATAGGRAFGEHAADAGTAGRLLRIGLFQLVRGHAGGDLSDRGAGSRAGVRLQFRTGAERVCAVCDRRGGGP